MPNPIAKGKSLTSPALMLNLLIPGINTTGLIDQNLQELKLHSRNLKFAIGTKFVEIKFTNLKRVS